MSQDFRKEQKEQNSLRNLIFTLLHDMELCDISENYDLFYQVLTNFVRKDLIGIYPYYSCEPKKCCLPFMSQSPFRLDKLEEIDDYLHLPNLEKEPYIFYIGNEPQRGFFSSISYGQYTQKILYLKEKISIGIPCDLLLIEKNFCVNNFPHIKVPF